MIHAGKFGQKKNSQSKLSAHGKSERRNDLRKREFD
jgi:hypothetical protein